MGSRHVFELAPMEALRKLGDPSNRRTSKNLMLINRGSTRFGAAKHVRVHAHLHRSLQEDRPFAPQAPDETLNGR